MAHRSAKEHLERVTRRVCRVGATKKCEPFGENGIRRYIVKFQKDLVVWHRQENEKRILLHRN